MSLAFLVPYLMLNVFRMLIHPSSGACDLFVDLFHGLYCSVRIEVVALAYLFGGVAALSYGYWVFYVCSMFFYAVS